jgi:mRNA interferase RelE/StbE
VTYSISILRGAQKEIARLEKLDFERVRVSISSLAEQPRPSNCKKLVGREGWRLRIGDLRVIYEIDDKSEMVIVLHVGHRKDVYS